MKVLVDTSVWSEALRRKRRRDTDVTAALEQLILDARAVIIGPIRQELLSGVRDNNQFRRLEERLTAFPDHPISSQDYVTAARFFDTCRARGVHGSNTDCLICAVAVRAELSVFTTDQDFTRFAAHLPVALHSPA